MLPGPVGRILYAVLVSCFDTSRFDGTDPRGRRTTARTENGSARKETGLARADGHSFERHSDRSFVSTAQPVDLTTSVGDIVAALCRTCKKNSIRTADRYEARTASVTLASSGWFANSSPGRSAHAMGAGGAGSCRGATGEIGAPASSSLSRRPAVFSKRSTTCWRTSEGCLTWCASSTARLRSCRASPPVSFLRLLSDVRGVRVQSAEHEFVRFKFFDLPIDFLSDLIAIAIDEFFHL